MTAWETLTSNSTLSSGNAWEHLNNQGGGSSGTTIIQVFNELDVSYEDEAVVHTQEDQVKVIMSTDLTPIIEVDQQLILQDEFIVVEYN